MSILKERYLTKKQAIQKYPIFTENVLKNLLFKDVGGFRSKVAHKIGRKIILSEEALLQYLAESW